MEKEKSKQITSKVITFDVLAKEGYVAEMNRQFLNALGMELVVREHEGSYAMFVVDQRDTVTGFIPAFDPNMVASNVDAEQKVAQQYKKTIHNRIQVFGNPVQHVTRTINKHMTSLDKLLPYIKDGYYVVNPDKNAVVTANNGNITFINLATGESQPGMSLSNTDTLFSNGWYIASQGELNTMLNSWKNYVAQSINDAAKETETPPAEPATPPANKRSTRKTPGTKKEKTTTSK